MLMDWKNNYKRVSKMSYYLNQSTDSIIFLSYSKVIFHKIKKKKYMWTHQ